MKTTPFILFAYRKPRHSFVPPVLQKPPATTVADGAQSSEDKPEEEGSAPFYLPIVQSPELDCTYEDVEVGAPQEEGKYTALSSLTADKEDGSQYTALIKTPSQSVQRTSQQLSGVQLDKTQPCVQESGQKVEHSEEIEPYDYVSFENSGSMSKSANGGAAAASATSEQAGLCQSQDEIYY